MGESSIRRCVADNDDPLQGAMRYTPFAPVKPATEGEGLSVTNRLFAGRNDIREAEEIVNVVRSIDKSESIALLVRSRAHLREVVSLLKGKVSTITRGRSIPSPSVPSRRTCSRS